MDNKIYDAMDKAHELGLKTYNELILFLGKRTGNIWAGSVDNNSFVYARIDFGRWLADCECGAANYVTEENKIYYCVTCGNSTVNGAARIVIFPENKNDIEKELLKRKVTRKLGLDGTNGALNSIGPISRSWSPGESVETLKLQREFATRKK